MKKYFLGATLALLINYCIGATYIIYKGCEKYVRTNRANARSVN